MMKQVYSIIRQYSETVSFYDQDGKQIDGLMLSEYAIPASVRVLSIRDACYVEDRKVEAALRTAWLKRQTAPPEYIAWVEEALKEVRRHPGGSSTSIYDVDTTSVNRLIAVFLAAQLLDEIIAAGYPSEWARWVVMNEVRVGEKSVKLALRGQIGRIRNFAEPSSDPCVFYFVSNSCPTLTEWIFDDEFEPVCKIKG